MKISSKLWMYLFASFNESGHIIDSIFNVLNIFHLICHYIFAAVSSNVSSKYRLILVSTTVFPTNIREKITFSHIFGNNLVQHVMRTP